MLSVVVQPEMLEFMTQVQALVPDLREVLQTVVGVGLSLWALVFMFSLARKGAV